MARLQGWSDLDPYITSHGGSGVVDAQNEQAGPGLFRSNVHNYVRFVLLSVHPLSQRQLFSVDTLCLLQLLRGDSHLILGSVGLTISMPCGGGCGPGLPERYACRKRSRSG
ncbi:hypothetical protein RB200_32130 [Streptomyces sp. PmtG]